MARLPQQPLSIHRSFVVRLYPEAPRGAARISGRVEHVVSGEAEEFRSVKELVRFFSRWTGQGGAARP
jgi:hypothetical protein